MLAHQAAPMPGAAEEVARYHGQLAHIVDQGEEPQVLERQHERPPARRSILESARRAQKTYLERQALEIAEAGSQQLPHGYVDDEDGRR